MERKIIATGDGSHTVEIPGLNVTYHSRHGAVQESMHVFVEAGFREALRRFGGAPLSVFEMGFGSGLNALLTAIEARKVSVPVEYFAVEAFPLKEEEAAALNYGALLGERALFNALHAAPWDMETRISGQFLLRKEEGTLQDLQMTTLFHVIYFDAFAPATQPELWTEERFRQLYERLVPGGILVTYCSKGDVRRALQAAGFTVEKLQGPPGKREMLRAHREA